MIMLVHVRFRDLPVGAPFVQGETPCWKRSARKAQRADHKDVTFYVKPDRRVLVNRDNRNK